MKEPVDGIILVLSCQKHRETRLKQFRLDRDWYGKWKVVYIIGDLFLDAEYKMDGNIMWLKCEDSYIHLLKKLVLALKYVYELYDITPFNISNADFHGIQNRCKINKLCFHKCGLNNDCLTFSCFL